MAQQYVGLNRGAAGVALSDFTTGTSTGATDMEFRFDDSKSITRQDIQLFIDALERYYGISPNNGGPTVPGL